MKKGIMIFLLSLIMLIANDSYIYGIQVQPEINIIIINKELGAEYLNCYGNPIIENGYTLVPIRTIAEKFGHKIEWDASSQSVSLTNEDNILKFTIGSQVVHADSDYLMMPVPPKLVNGRTYIPLRFVAELLNKHVIWLTGIDKNYYILISELMLLNDTDVNVLNDNYYVLCEEPTAYYALKKDGVTARGIRIGDNYNRVIDKYGEPHIKTINTDGYLYAKYSTPFIPATGSGSLLTFVLKDNKVVNVEIDPPV